jgi:hypothetical protein
MPSSVLEPPSVEHETPQGRLQRIWASVDVQSTAVLMTLAIIVGL